MSVDPLSWWKDALAGKKPAVTTTPECGWYLAKIDGRLVPGSIWYHGPKDENGDPCGDEELRAEIGGELWHPEDAWGWLAKRPVSEEEYTYWLDRYIAEGGLNHGRSVEAERALPA